MFGVNISSDVKCTREECEVGESAVAVVEPLHVHRVRQMEADAVRVVPDALAADSVLRDS